MKSYQTLYTELQNKTGDDSSERLTRFKTDINDTQRKVLSASKWPFLEDTKTKSTVASQNNYKIHNSIDKVLSVTVTLGTTIYRPKPVESVKMWEYLQSLRIAVSSDIPQFFYKEGDEILLWPTPATSGNTITIRGRLKKKDLSLDDYTTGTITSIANGATTVTGSGTSWATGSTGNRIRIDYTTGDFMWYDIASITDTTHLELNTPYEGTSVAAATETYTIGEFSIIPEDFDDILICRPMALYYESIEDQANARSWWLRYDGGVEAGLSKNVAGLLGQMIEEHSERFAGVYLDEEQPTEPSTADLIIKNFGYSGEGW